MGLVANIACKTAGIAGLSAMVYDANKKANMFAKVGEQKATADTFEQVVATKRTMGTASATTNVLQQKVSDFRTSNPIVPFFGKINGYIKGFLKSAGDNIIPVTLSAVALGGGKKWQKAGAWGLAGYLVYMVLKEGFGVGKSTPVD